MKKVRVNAYQIGLVFKNDTYERMISEGTYWFWKNEKVAVYDTTKQFVAPVELNILLQDNALANQLEILLVKDNEIALHYENDLLKNVLTSGRYAFWKGIVENKFIVANISDIVIEDNIDRKVLQNKLVAPYVRSVTVESYEKALLFIDGKYKSVLESGIYYWWKNNIVVNVARVDTRQLQMEINGQEILTKDKAALRINAWAQYKVADIEKAVLQNKEYDKQLYVAFQLTLREYVAGFNFDELLDKKDNIATFILQSVKDKAEALGVAVQGFGIRDIIFARRCKGNHE